MKVDTCVLTITLDRGSAMTLSRQIYQQIRELILAGQLTGGARLPSTRAFADDHGVSRTVVLAAYDQLLAEGYLDAASAAADCGLHLSPLSKQYASASNRMHGFLLGYGGWPVQAIEKGVETLERSVARSIARRSA